jgi:hypothetical protein
MNGVSLVVIVDKLEDDRGWWRILEMYVRVCGCGCG